MWSSSPHRRTMHLRYRAISTLIPFDDLGTTATLPPSSVAWRPAPPETCTNLYNAWRDGLSRFAVPSEGVSAAPTVCTREFDTDAFNGQGLGDPLVDAGRAAGDEGAFPCES